ncbi:14423_t:CDS:1, partial [Cetraspora pellucida]
SAVASTSTKITQVQKSKKNIYDLVLNCLELNVINKQENEDKNNGEVSDDEVNDLDKQDS